MDKQIKLLITKIKKTIKLLRDHNIEHWAVWLEEDVKKIERLDFNGVEHLLGAYGGMGSFNDVYFSPENGNSIAEQDVDKVNAEFRKLKEEIFVLADDLRREHMKAL